MMTGLISAQLAGRAEQVERAIARHQRGPVVKVERDFMRKLQLDLVRLSNACVELEDALDTLSIVPRRRFPVAEGLQAVLSEMG